MKRTTLFKDEDIPFTGSKREYKDLQEFDKAMKDAQSSEKEELSHNVNRAAQIAMNLNSSAGIKHVVHRLCVVSKDPMARRETAVYAADSILRHLSVDEGLFDRYQKHLELHIRNIFKRALKVETTRIHLAGIFLNKILVKWKAKGWFEEELDNIVDLVCMSAPTLGRPEILLKLVQKPREEDFDMTAVGNPDVTPAGLLEDFDVGDDFGVDSRMKPETMTPSLTVLNSIPATPRGPGVLNSMSATPHLSQLIPRTPFASATNNPILNRVPSTPAAALGIPPNGDDLGVDSLVKPDTMTPSLVVLNSIPATPRGPSGLNSISSTPNLSQMIPRTPFASATNDSVLHSIPSALAHMQRVPSTPFEVVSKAPLDTRLPSTPVAGGVAFTAAAAGGPMTPAPDRLPLTPFMAPFTAVPTRPSGNLPFTPVPTRSTQPFAPAAPSGAQPFKPAAGGVQPFTAAPSRVQPFTAAPGNAQPFSPAASAGVLSRIPFTPFAPASGIPAVQPFTSGDALPMTPTAGRAMPDILGLSGDATPRAPGMAQPKASASVEVPSVPGTVPTEKATQPTEPTKATEGSNHSAEELKRVAAQELQREDEAAKRRKVVATSGEPTDEVPTEVATPQPPSGDLSPKA